jgi:hypothetical protein
MEFKLGDMVVLNDESQKYYKRNEKELTAVFIISKIERDSVFYYGYRIDDQLKNKVLLPVFDYRMTTESEIKSYQLKNLFNKRSSTNGI